MPEMEENTPDRNKTTLTHEVTRAASMWLIERGFKPVETEVPVDKRWIADLAAVAELTKTECVNLKLVDRLPRYPTDISGRNDPRIARYRQKRNELDKAFRLIPSPITGLVEVKTSRSDFLGDKKWQRPPPVEMLFVAVPHGLINRDEVPTNWSVLEYRNSKVKLVRLAPLATISVEQKISVLYNVAMRLDHRTRYAGHREQEKRYRAQGAERQTLARLRDVVRCVLRIFKGDRSVDEALLFARITCNLPVDLRAELEDLHGKAIIR